MNKINFGRVLLGGLVAGFVLNIGEYLFNGVIMAKQMEEGFFRKFHLAPPTGTFIAEAVALTFVLGIVIVFLYALIRPRLGAGPKTAVIAGLAAWFCIYVYKGALNAALGLVPARMVLIAIVWGLVEYSLGAIAGAWLYKEA